MSTIVCIDDEPMLCRALAGVLRSIADVVTFCDPLEAIEHINQHPPALVICDFRMPKMDGLTVLRHLDVEVPFVLISGYLTLDVEEDPRLAAVLAKPMRAEALIELVKPFLDDE